MQIEAKITELGYSLPGATPPGGNYVPTVRAGNLVYLSGHGPRKPGGGLVTGKLGADVSKEDGYAAARLTGLALLSSLKNEIGDLDRVVRFVKVLGMVNCTADFHEPPAIINGFSDFIVELYGDRGRHARSAVGMQSLPGGMCVEIEAIVEVE